MACYSLDLCITFYVFFVSCNIYDLGNRRLWFWEGGGGREGGGGPDSLAQPLPKGGLWLLRSLNPTSDRLKSSFLSGVRS